MSESPTTSPQFAAAVEAISAGDADHLRDLIDRDPSLPRQRARGGELYAKDPYLLWYVAENPVRTGTLPANIARVAELLIDAARVADPGGLQAQLDHALGLVCTGRVARESGRLGALIDVLLAAGASPSDALEAAIAHQETEAARLLLAAGAARTLLTDIAFGEPVQAARVQAASPAELQRALMCAAMYGRAEIIGPLVERGADVNAFGPFHPHSTALHQAVANGSAACVRVLLEAGADPTIADLVFQGDALGWAAHFGRDHIAELIRSHR